VSLRRIVSVARQIGDDLLLPPNDCTTHGHMPFGFGEVLDFKLSVHAQSSAEMHFVFLIWDAQNKSPAAKRGW
jgi:hypothetical protein